MLAWDPQHKDGVKLLEHVQRTTRKMIRGWNTSPAVVEFLVLCRSHGILVHTNAT